MNKALLPLYAAVLIPYGPGAVRLAFEMLFLLPLATVLIPACAYAVSLAVCVVLFPPLTPVFVPGCGDPLLLAHDKSDLVFLLAIVVPPSVAAVVDRSRCAWAGARDPPLAKP